MGDFSNLSDIDPSVFTINRNQLDIEWEQQSANVFEVGRLAAQALLLLDDLERQLVAAKATADYNIRNNPAQYDVAKVTEVSVASAVMRQPEINDLMDKIALARCQYNTCKAAAAALENKKKGLECLTQLRAMNYYSAK